MHSKILSISIPLLAGLGLLATNENQADELSRGAMLTAACESCHGTNGNSPGSIPSISDRSADDILAALTGFRTGERTATIMDRHVRGYTDEELRLIAEHLALQKNESE
jgi:sulfide dehydrogenase cytochrome subunit